MSSLGGLLACRPEPRDVADVPDTIDLKKHRDLASWGYNRPIRYAILGLVAASCLAGLLNLFGQRPSTSTAESPQASLELTSPERVRGGLLFQARFTLTAHDALTHAVLQLGPGWTEGMQINTIEPSPIAETSRNGSLALTLGAVPAGEHYTLYMQFQVDPTNVGHRDADVTLYDGDTKLFTIDRTITVFP
jgi:hypothetical protein